MSQRVRFGDDPVRRVFVVALTQGEDALQWDETVMSEMFSIFSECPGAAPEG